MFPHPHRYISTVLIFFKILNLHLICILQITGGERLTLTLWFSRDGSHDEDAKLISFISRSPLNSLDTKFDLFLPSPASNNMYWFPPEQALNYQSGFDLRCARIYILGYDLYCSREKSCSLAVDSSDNFSKLLTEPLQLARGDELFNKEFTNILHALQVFFPLYLEFIFLSCRSQIINKPNLISAWGAQVESSLEFSYLTFYFQILMF